MAYETWLSDSSQVVVYQEYGNGHLGTDLHFYPLQWSNVCFPKSGVVTASQYGGSGGLDTYGEWYQVNCPDNTSYRLAHLRQGSRAVGTGVTVTAGQFAGIQGTTGNSTGIHLHIEYFIGGVRTNPYPLFGFPGTLGTYDIVFGGGDIPPPGAGWTWSDLQQRNTVPRDFAFDATQVQEPTMINTVDGVVIVQPGEWIIQPKIGKCLWKRVQTPRKTVYLEIPEIIINDVEVLPDE